MATFPLEVSYFAGTESTIGLSHGEEHRELIAEFIETLRDSLNRRAVTPISNDTVRLFLQRNLIESANYDAGLHRELVGIAQGSHQDTIDIAFLNSFLELVQFRDRRFEATAAGCTAFGATNEATSDGRCYVAQNYEMEAFYRKFRVLHQVSPDNRPSSLVFSYAGVLGCAGVNSEGIALCINFLHCNDTVPGTIYPFLVRKILSQRRTGDAIGAATIGNRAGGMNFLIGDTHGTLCSVETSARSHDIIFYDDGIAAHSNHYVSPHMRQFDRLLWDTTYDSSISRRGSSVVRLHNARRQLQMNRGSIDTTVLRSIARDHGNLPFSICCHGSPEDEDLVRGETNASLIVDTSERSLLIAPGCPCSFDYTEARLQ